MLYAVSVFVNFVFSAFQIEPFFQGNFFRLSLFLIGLGASLLLLIITIYWRRFIRTVGVRQIPANSFFGFPHVFVSLSYIVVADHVEKLFLFWVIDLAQEFILFFSQHIFVHLMLLENVSPYRFIKGSAVKVRFILF